MVRPTLTTMVDAVHARGVVKRYGDVTALDGVDLTVPTGTVLALLGPNGAGKTTMVKVLTTLITPDAGEVQVAGVDALAEPAEVRRRIGVSGQYAAVDEYLTGFENLDMVGRLYHLGARRSRERARELLETFRPGRRRGPARRRPTPGACAAAWTWPGRSWPLPRCSSSTSPPPGWTRAAAWTCGSCCAAWCATGTTLLLTTQYLEEADLLADDIVVVDHGRAIAQGTADQLKGQVGGDRVEVEVAREEQVGAARAVLARTGAEVSDDGGRRLTVPVTGGTAQMVELLRSLDDAGVALLDVGLRRPTLDDVFLTLTGASS